MILGIDIGTSTLKSVLINEDGNILGTSYRIYDISAPVMGWAEQDVDELYRTLCDSIRELISKLKKSVPITGIGLSGQTHGIVCLDENKCPIQPAILWSDQRTIHQVDNVSKLLGEGYFESITFNKPATGFGILSLLWLKEHEPRVFSQIKYVISIKDYIRFRLCGELGTERSDASGICFLDMNTGYIAKELCEKLGIPPQYFLSPKLSTDIAGYITPVASKETNIALGTPIVYGGMDCCMQTLGNGAINIGDIVINIGTAGQVLTPIKNTHNIRKDYRINMFNHVIKQHYQLYGATLNAGIALKWLRNNIYQGKYSYEDLVHLASLAPVGCDGLVYLPYLMGELSPHMDPYAKSIFWGQRPQHDIKHITRSVFEGVAFSLYENLILLKNMGIQPKQYIVTGGGAQSYLWPQILSDIIGEDILVSSNKESGCIGAAITAAVGLGVFNTYQEAIDQMQVVPKEKISPNLKNTPHYRELFECYCDIYQTNKILFRKYSEIGFK